MGGDDALLIRLGTLPRLHIRMLLTPGPDVVESPAGTDAELLCLAMAVFRDG